MPVFVEEDNGAHAGVAAALVEDLANMLLERIGCDLEQVSDLGVTKTFH